MTDTLPEPRKLTRSPAARPVTKSEKVAASLAQQIVNRELPFSSFLASEHELSAYYQVSRPNIRQALQRLAAAGMTETKHGVGTVVSSSDRWNLFDPLILGAFMQGNNLAAVAQELLELRVMAEVECAGLAAKRITEAQLANLEMWVQRMGETVDDIDRITQADLAFHTIIIDASHNRFLQGIMAFLAEPLGRARLLTMEIGGHAGRERALREHRTIHSALAAQDVVAARAAMSHHMQHLEEDMKKALANV